MATYGSGFKIAGAVSASRSATGTLVSALGSDQYAIINVITSGTSATISVGGQTAVLSSGSTITLYVGPSQSVTVPSISSATVFASGVIFQNG